MQDLWTLKYRADTLEGLLGNEHAVKTLSELVQSRTLPHLIFYGPENSGKTTSSLALARQLYGDTWKNNFAYFNASDFFDQGKRYLVRDRRFIRFIGTDDPKKIYKSVIDIFKEIINEYAGMAPLDADYKIIYIDNAESLSSDAQHALRRIMEKYSSTCRFILSTTRPSKLISPLRSRGLQVFFAYVSDSVLKPYLERIVLAEKLNLSSRAVDAILYLAKGNVARAVQTLQLAALKEGAEITEEIVFEATMKGRDEIVDSLLEAALAGDFLRGRQLIDEMIIEKGFSGIDILEGLTEALIDSGETDKDVARLIVKISETDARLTDATSERIQLEELISTFS
ncbi:Replication factor C small subunit [Methanosarcina horonobensis HB-1 = JCM 15518]|uniref:Replication factor C small subunit n=1 Tax=Methanosarcina horonobensis HB-1 = JCM 15518 TaxID=1434110 RepID=A0A0E3WVR2_9EURY|nr:AAA family ATPase [Methanosarcina horonobensis]AKB80465.1 Replication factor C small subunit [Methanosarcina horonobensis HB-1 = JCM 15518]